MRVADVFGLNGRRLLDGLAEGRPSAEVLASPDGSAEGKKEQLAEVLQGHLDGEALRLLQQQLQPFDRLVADLAVLDRRLAEGLREHEPLLCLLQTMPGIDAPGPRSLLPEAGPDPAATLPGAEQLAARAGLAPSTNESVGKRRAGAARSGSPHVRALLIECVRDAARTKDCQFHDHRKAMTARRG